MKRHLLTAPRAAAALGVKPETLYAYVSRGLLARHRLPGSRASWFDPGDIDRLAGRGRGGRPEREVRIESAVTALEGGHYWYRGQDPLALARTHSFEQVAEFLWTGELPAEAAWTADPAAVRIGRKVQAVLPADALPFDRARLVTAALAGTDPFRHDLSPAAVVAAARRLIASVAESLPALGRPRGDGFAAVVWSRISRAAPTAAQLNALDDALVILADHELAASTFAVRIAAALRADPYGAASAGFGVLGGALHGAVSLAAEALLRELDASGSVATVVERRLRRGETLPGIGHPIYPGGDPRGPALLDVMRRVARDRRRLRQVDALLAATRTRGLPPPNVDLGIAALVHVLGLVPGAGEVVFALARMAGWLAHALEEYERPSTIRPRAVYTGVRPA
jgi:citrate synthase